MNAHETPSVPLHHLLLKLVSMKRLTKSADVTFAEQTVESHTLLIIVDSEGTLYLNNRFIRFEAFSAFQLAPGDCYQFDGQTNETMDYYCLVYSVVRVDYVQPSFYQQSLFPGKDELRLYPLAPYIKLLESILVAGKSLQGIEAYKQNLAFQKLMGMLLEQHLPASQGDRQLYSVEDTMHYIQLHYKSPLTVKELAALTNMAQWQYSSLFKALTGKKPLDYLVSLRIDHAKEWLANSHASLREIAEWCGFADEYYFSRRFRQMTGGSPRQYALSMRQRVQIKDWLGHQVIIPAEPQRILYYGETLGDLHVLGFQSIGGEDFSDFPMFNKEQATELAPDLIILASGDEQIYEQAADIAPTLAFNSWGTLEERLLMLGDWLGKKQEALRWLARHKRRTEQMWQQLSSHLRAGETASVFIFERGNRLFIMAGSGLASTLYHPLGFAPVSEVKMLIAAQRAYKEITVASLPQYAGDRLFMIVPETDDSRHAMESLISSPLWKQLAAVQRGQAYLVDNIWNYGDAETGNKLLGMLPKLLQKPS
ncbi:AraC family transcriptional regulator [Paenibacillus sp. FSL H8-0537]|uniref:AraC family transcriptional regulator n=1 Tax=Paenibacillus sp. FSL H8-0537 TaxID=2921399 RepID=UPI003100CA86